MNPSPRLKINSHLYLILLLLIFLTGISQSIFGSAGPELKSEKEPAEVLEVTWNSATHRLTRVIWSGVGFIAVGYNGTISPQRDRREQPTTFIA
jgi:hypothetical protein